MLFRCSPAYMHPKREDLSRVSGARSTFLQLFSFVRREHDAPPRLDKINTVTLYCRSRVTENLQT